MKKYIGIGLVLLVLACVLFAADTGGTVVLTRQTDNRKDWRYPVWDAIITATWDDDDTGDVTQAVTINGTIQKIIFVTPNCTSGATFQVVIKDNEGFTIFDSGERVKNATYDFSVHEPVTGTISVVVGPNLALGATNPDTIVTLRGI